MAGLAGRATVEQAICVLVLAQGMLMAGTGDLELIRTVRYLRSRVGANHSTGSCTCLRSAKVVEADFLFIL